MASLPNQTAANCVNLSSSIENLSSEITMDGMGSNGEVSSEESGAMDIEKNVELVQESIPNKATNRKSVLTLTKVSTRVAKHGLAPAGMAIPLRKKAFRVGGSDLSKCPLKESSQEKYHRIKAEQEERKKKQHNRAVNKLKKAGKVATLAPFMF